MRTFVGAVAALALGVIGCGGGGRSTHEVFVHDAAAVCRDANGAFREVDIVRPTAERAAAVLERVVEIGGAALERLHDLKPPNVDQPDVDAWLGALEQALDEVEYTRQLLVGERVDLAIEAALRADLLTRRARALARAVGLERACRVPRLIPDG